MKKFKFYLGVSVIVLIFLACFIQLYYVLSKAYNSIPLQSWLEAALVMSGLLIIIYLGNIFFKWCFNERT